MSDYDKFNEMVANQEERAPEKTSRALSPREPRSNEEAKTETKSVGALVQYAPIGNGFTFVPQTFKRLEAGRYKITAINNAIAVVPVGLQSDRILRLPDTRTESLIEEIKGFWDLKTEFKNGNAAAHGGFLHKRGYMLFGPPGSGKTSAIKLIMEEIIARDGLVIYGDTYPGMIGTAIKAIREIEPDRNMVIVLEDFDALIQRYGEGDYLSVLDGEDSVDGALFLATTNYPHLFDPRMYNRPGRFSDVVYMGMPSAPARRMYLEQVLKQADQIDTIVGLTEGFSIDHLRALVLGVFFEKRELNSEVERLRKLFVKPREKQGTTFGIK